MEATAPLYRSLSESRRPAMLTAQPLIVAALIAALLVAAVFFITLQSMNQKLGAFNQMIDTLARMDHKLSETDQQLVTANRALTTTHTRLTASLTLAAHGNQNLEQTNKTLRDLDVQITRLTNRISSSHLLKI